MAIVACGPDAAEDATLSCDDIDLGHAAGSQLACCNHIGTAGFGGALLLLPVLTHAIGPRAAVPILTLAQLMGNISRGWFGFKDIRWRSVVLFNLGALPTSIVGPR